MKFFRNISIKTRLMALFIVFMLIFVSINIFSLVRLKQVGGLTRELYEHPLKVSTAALKVGMQIEKMHSIMRDVTSLDTDMQINEAMAEVKRLRNELDTNLDFIRDNIDDDEGAEIERKTRAHLETWESLAQREFDLLLEDNREEASNMSKTKGEECSLQIQDSILELSKYSVKNADEFVLQSENIQSNQRAFLTTFITISALLLLIIFILVINSILLSLSILKDTMNESVTTGKLNECSLTGNNEITDMSKDFNGLIRMLKNQFWIKDGRNELNARLSGDLSLVELCDKALSFLARYLESGRGALYLFDRASESLYMKASYAYSERESLSNVFMLGNGIIGQVGLERKPILLKNIKRSEEVITTGTMSQEPLNSYSFPILYNNELYGVIELLSFEHFNELKRKFLDECSGIISTALHSAIQKQKVEELLLAAGKARDEAERARIEAQSNAKELQAANIRLEDQHQQLQQQTEEIQQANSQLEEQQQQLQQQNCQLEEQQMQLKHQTELLDTKNKSLESARIKLDEHIRKLEISNKYKTEFLANMSHELRTPLNSIILLSKLLNKNEANALCGKDLEKVRVIYSAGNELLRLINDILDLSKVEAGKMELNITSFSSKDLIKEIEDIFSAEAREKELDFIICNRVDRDIIGDRDKISQVLRNFLSNAFKFTKRGFVELKMERIEDEKRPLKISVKDTGIGIPKEKQNIIFNEFHQVDGSISREYGGTGLGLAICKKMSDFIDGKIKVVSEEGDGSEFILLLPETYTGSAVDDGTVDFTKVSLEYSQKNKKKLLIVEDENIQRDAIKELLNIDGVVITEVDGEQGALKEIEKEAYDLIILDLGLKKGEGINICKYTRQNYSDIPIIVYTGKDISQEQEYEIKKYVDSIIIKTSNSSERLMEEAKLFLHKVKERDKNLAYINKRLDPEYSLNLEGKRILIVDDDVKNVFVLTSALENYGAQIIAARNGKEALEKMSINDIDLVLMDIMMPVMNGYDTIRAIRINEKLKDIPVIALTAKALREDKDKSIEAGANDYISKPVDYDTLIHLVKAWILKSRQH